jgi:hypothetical protein
MDIEIKKGDTDTKSMCCFRMSSERKKFLNTVAKENNISMTAVLEQLIDHLQESYARKKK